MSTTVRYEIEVEHPELAARTEADAREILAYSAGNDQLPFTFVPTSIVLWNERSFHASGEEGDWSRPHAARDAEVRAAILSRLPGALVTTRWLVVDDIEWDESFEPPRGCCGEFETGSGQHGDECEDAEVAS